MRDASRWLLGGVCTFVLALPAGAHHVMEGRAPETLADQLLSGVAHPLIGLDHVASLLVMGLIISLSTQRLAMLSTYLLAIVAGVALHVAQIDVSWAELGIGVSVALLGGGLAGLVSKPGVVALLFMLTGIFHGYAYGETVGRVEPSYIVAYLLGLTLIQGVVAVSVARVARRLKEKQPARTVAALRASGLGSAAFGVVLAVMALTRG
jgi:urease accessory protein